MYLEKVHRTDICDFRRIVEAYWQEVMPQSDVVKNPERREAYFRERFTWAGAIGSHTGLSRTDAEWASLRIR
jgi:hypothetical protein